MKNNLTEAGNIVIDEFNSRKRKASISLKLSKRKWKRTLFRKKK